MARSAHKVEPPVGTDVSSLRKGTLFFIETLYASVKKDAVSLKRFYSFLDKLMNWDKSEDLTTGLKSIFLTEKSDTSKALLNDFKTHYEKSEYVLGELILDKWLKEKQKNFSIILSLSPRRVLVLVGIREYFLVEELINRVAKKINIPPDQLVLSLDEKGKKPLVVGQSVAGLKNLELFLQSPLPVAKAEFKHSPIDFFNNIKLYILSNPAYERQTVCYQTAHNMLRLLTAGDNEAYFDNLQTKMTILITDFFKRDADGNFHHPIVRELFEIPDSSGCSIFNMDILPDGKHEFGIVKGPDGWRVIQSNLLRYSLGQWIRGDAECFKGKGQEYWKKFGGFNCLTHEQIMEFMNLVVTNYDPSGFGGCAIVVSKHFVDPNLIACNAQSLITKMSAVAFREPGAAVEPAAPPLHLSPLEVKGIPTPTPLTIEEWQNRINNSGIEQMGCLIGEIIDILNTRYPKADENPKKIAKRAAIERAVCLSLSGFPDKDSPLMYRTLSVDWLKRGNIVHDALNLHSGVRLFDSVDLDTLTKKIETINRHREKDQDSVVKKVELFN